MLSKPGVFLIMPCKTYTKCFYCAPNPSRCDTNIMRCDKGLGEDSSLPPWQVSLHEDRTLAPKEQGPQGMFSARKNPQDLGSDQPQSPKLGHLLRKS